MFVSPWIFSKVFVLKVSYPAVLYASALAVYMHTVLPSRSLVVESRPDPGKRVTFWLTTLPFRPQGELHNLTRVCNRGSRTS